MNKEYRELKKKNQTKHMKKYTSIFTDKDGLIAALSGRYKSYRTKAEIDPENLANAHLIASAPDLLSALRFLLADYIAIEGDKLTGSSVPIEMAQAAILKAEGNK